MKNIYSIKFYKTKSLLLFLIVLTLVFAGLMSFAASQKNQVNNKVLTHSLAEANKINKKNGVQKDKSDNSNNVLAATSFTKPTSLKLTEYISPTTTKSPTTLNSANDQSPKDLNSTNTFSEESTPASSPTSIPQQTIHPTQTSIPATQIVTVEIQAPDSTSNFTINITDGMNVCDILQKAKTDGKINSITVDDSYLSAFNSKYVSEINGYKNNWTFKVNGDSPLGCSLSNPKPNDTIVWKFG